MNIATALKTEISRIARKELRGETEHLKKASSQQRSEIAALKRRVLSLERSLKALSKAPARTPKPVDETAAPQRLTFSASGLAAQRKRLGLTSNEMGSLIGVSAQSIYKWEQGKTTPRASQLPAIRAIRKLGKREATARLAAL